jgi:hypothetical protein
VADVALQFRARCPFCYSPDVKTDPKPDASSYHRCERCGQMWHPERLRTSGRDSRR